MKVQNKTRFKLISICSAVLYAAVLLGNAALSLEWVEGRRKISLFERVPRRLFIQSSSSHVRILLGGPCWLNAVNKLYFSKERRGAYCFLMPRLFGVVLFRLNAIGYCVFRKSAAALVFVRLILRAAFCPGFTVWIVFIKFCEYDQHCSILLAEFYVYISFLLIRSL